MKDDIRVIDLDNTNTIPQVDEGELVEAVTADLTGAVLFLQEEETTGISVDAPLVKKEEKVKTFSESVKQALAQEIAEEEMADEVELVVEAEAEEVAAQEAEESVPATVENPSEETKEKEENSLGEDVSEEFAEVTPEDLDGGDTYETVEIPTQEIAALAGEEETASQEKKKDPASGEPGSITAAMINLDDYPDKADVGKLIAKKQKDLSTPKKPSFLEKLSQVEAWHYLAFSIAILIVSLVFLVVGKVSKDKQDAKTQESMTSLGQQILAMGTPGQTGVYAMEEYASALVAPLEDETENVTVITEEVDNTELSVVFISIEQDLKIKFTSVASGRLIKDTEFVVTITGPGGTFTLKDDDGDGIIHKTGLKPGDYTVSVAAVGDHVFLDVPNQVNVKDKAAYVQIDVAQEIKTESEINVAVEDTAVNAVVEEVKVTDTVEWVDSTQETKGDTKYTQIDKNEIKEPAYAMITSDILFAEDGESSSENKAGTEEEEKQEEDKEKEEETEQETKEEKTDDKKNVVSITLEKTEVSVKEGESLQVHATAKLEDGTEISEAAKFSYKSKDTAVATVDDKGNVKGEKGGNTEVTVTFKDEKGNEKSAVVKVVVNKDAAKDKETKLLDQKGRQVYVKDGENYREATYADYYTASAFYVKDTADVQYTGWQNINGNTYYYDKNGVPVTGDQVIGGITYHFNNDGILAMDKNGIIGIDVSKWNGTIDWNAVAASGVKFAIIRCGYRGSTGGALIMDPTFATNIQGAKAAGIKVGIYFFTQAITEVEAIEEASMCISLANTYGISYPIFIDTEGSGGRADPLNKVARTAIIKAFCETVKSAGYTPGVYASKFWFYDNLDYSQLSSYKIWVAQYASATDFSGHYDIWQHSEKGTVAGINGRVDMNISYMGY